MNKPESRQKGADSEESGEMAVEEQAMSKRGGENMEDFGDDVTGYSYNLSDSTEEDQTLKEGMSIQEAEPSYQVGLIEGDEFMQEAGPIEEIAVNSIEKGAKPPSESGSAVAIWSAQDK